ERGRRTTLRDAESQTGWAGGPPSRTRPRTLDLCRVWCPKLARKDTYLQLPKMRYVGFDARIRTASPPAVRSMGSRPLGVCRYQSVRPDGCRIGSGIDSSPESTTCIILRRTATQI